MHRSQNNAVMDTGELRLPSFAEAGVGYGYSSAPVFVESWVPQTYAPTYEPTCQPTYPQTEYPEYSGPAYSDPLYSDPLFGPMPTTLPDGRPLFRD